MKIQVDEPSKELHVMITHCLLSGWHVQVKLTCHSSWMSSQEGTKTVGIYLSSLPLTGDTDHLKWIVICSSGLMKNFLLKVAAGKDFFFFPVQLLEAGMGSHML